MERLPLAPIYKADCETKAIVPYFKGDAGSIYLVECPDGYLILIFRCIN